MNSFIRFLMYLACAVAAQLILIFVFDPTAPGICNDARGTFDCTPGEQFQNRIGMLLMMNVFTLGAPTLIVMFLLYMIQKFWTKSRAQYTQ